MISFSHARFISHSIPSQESIIQKNFRITELSVSIQRIDGATVSNTLDKNVRVDTMQSVSKPVTVCFCSYSSCRESNQNNLTK